MSDSTLALTHYWPWDGDEQRAVCGASMHDDARRHSLLPTCPDCAAYLKAEDARVAPARYQALAGEVLDAMRFWSVAGADEKHLQACIADLLEHELAEVSR